MHEHGIANPNVYQRVGWNADGSVNAALLDKYLEIKRAAGLKIAPLYMVNISAGTATDEAGIQAHAAKLAGVIAYAKGKGINEVYFYGSDEAPLDVLKSQRNMWKAVHAVGGRVSVACGPGFFDLVGDLLDLPIISGPPPADVPRVHALGRKVFSYAMPQAGLEQPYTYRYYMGLWLDRSGMDGSCTYAYQHCVGSAWNEFDSQSMRGHVFAYPTVDGVVDTIQWEGMREGVDDVRYLTTLRKAIERARHSWSWLRRRRAHESELWLKALDIEGDLSDLRRQMQERIVALGAAR